MNTEQLEAEANEQADKMMAILRPNIDPRAISEELIRQVCMQMFLRGVQYGVEESRLMVRELL